MRIFIVFIYLLLFTIINALGQNLPMISNDKIALLESKQAYAKINFAESDNAALYDLIYQRMEWDIDPAVRYISGNVTSYVKSLTTNLIAVEFDLHNAMTIDSVKQRGAKVQVSETGDKFTVTLVKSLAENAIDSLTVYYKGTPPSSDFKSFFKNTHGSANTPIIWTLSEPYGARDWWPCKQTLIDKIDSIDIIVTSPEAYRTASIGLLVSETTKGGKKTMHWKHRYPITTYLVAIAVTNYVNYSDYVDKDGPNELEILNYVYPEYLTTAKANTPSTVGLIELFNRLIGEYPFAKEKYGHAQFGWGGGMEHQTMSFMGDFSFGIIAHELAHQWFGDCVTLNDWHDIWLNEGFATYLSLLAYENIKPNSYKSSLEYVIDNITSAPYGSVYVTDVTDVEAIFSDRLSYSKGGYILHMLRGILGDEDFFKGLQAYYNDPAVHNGYASHEQFVNHMEVAGDTTLTEFFDDWYYGQGYPHYTANYYKTSTGEINISLSQQPSHSSVSFFEMPVQVSLRNAANGSYKYYILTHTANNQKYTVNPGFEVDTLEIDPKLWIISKKTVTNSIVSNFEDDIAKVYPNPVGEILTLNYPEDLDIFEINLFNEAGQIIRKYGSNMRELDFENIQSGMYFLQILDNKGTHKHKVIKR